MKKTIDYLIEEIEKLHESDQPYFDNDDATTYDGDSTPILKAIRAAQEEAIRETVKECLNQIEIIIWQNTKDLEVVGDRAKYLIEETDLREDVLSVADKLIKEL